MLRSKLVPEVSALAAAGSAKNYAALARTKGRLANKAREIAADIVRFAEEGPNGPPVKCALNCVRLAFTRAS
jgi:hypothetical protein